MDEARAISENKPQDSVASWILSVEDEGEGSRGFQGCALDDGVGWLNNRFVVLLFRVSGNVGRIGGLQ